MNLLNGNNKDIRKNPNRIIYETKYSKIEKSKICRIQPLKKLECSNFLKELSGLNPLSLSNN